LTTLFAPQTRFHVAAPKAAGAMHAGYGCACLLAALVLYFFSSDTFRYRLRWLGCGLAALGAGALTLGLAPSLLDGPGDANAVMYAALLIRSAAGGFFVLALAPWGGWRGGRRSAAALAAGLGLTCVAAVAAADHLPALITGGGAQTACDLGSRICPSLTSWHWALSTIPLILALTAATLALQHNRRRALERWLVVAMVLFAGTETLTLLWPSTYTSVITTAELLGLAFAVVVAAGSMVELKRAVARWRVLLAAEQDQSQRLADLGILKANFTAMAAHELDGPVSAIRGLTTMLGTGALSAHQHAQTVDAIQMEVDALHALVHDVRASSSFEQDDFGVELRPSNLDSLIAEARAYSATLPSRHPIHVACDTGLRAMADSGRVAQVLRNLLSNAAKYSPPGAPIYVRFQAGARHIHVTVRDCGSGIAPEDMGRVFEGPGFS